MIWIFKEFARWGRKIKMKCKCGGKMQVIDSRERPEGIMRRRRCGTCGKTIKTMETLAEGFVSVHDQKEMKRRQQEAEARKLAERIFGNK